MIVVADITERIEVGETREDLVAFLKDTCSSEYSEKVLAWFDTKPQVRFYISNAETMDEWTVR